MADEKNLKQAQIMFEILCKTMEMHKWKCEKDQENLRIKCQAQGDDLTIDIHLGIDAERMLITLLSPVLNSSPEDKRIDLAVAVSIANNRLVDGCFDYNIRNGSIWYRMTTSFLESLVGSEVFSYMLFYSCGAVDAYNDKFMMLGHGMMSLEQYMKAISDKEEQ